LRFALVDPLSGHNVEVKVFGLLVVAEVRDDATGTMLGEHPRSDGSYLRHDTGQLRI
jgi:hypothetical protein